MLYKIGLSQVESQKQAFWRAVAKINFRTHCVFFPVIRASPEECRKHGKHVIKRPSGYLSQLSANHARHEKHCPLVIRASPGQRINFTLLDFALRNSSVSHSHGAMQFCQQYAIIREPGLSSSVTLCSEDVRQKEAYISRTHEVEVLELARGDGASFMLKYQGTVSSEMS